MTEELYNYQTSQISLIYNINPSMQGQECSRMFAMTKAYAMPPDAA